MNLQILKKYISCKKNFEAEKFGFNDANCMYMKAFLVWISYLQRLTADPLPCLHVCHHILSLNILEEEAKFHKNSFEPYVTRRHLTFLHLIFLP
jgi:hypothetical protein